MSADATLEMATEADRADEIVEPVARAVVVPEMNAGQLSLEVERLLPEGSRLSTINHVNGEPIPPAEMVARIEALARDE